MIKKTIAIAALLCFSTMAAALDVNQATAADLDSIKGIGPGTSSKILNERKSGAFKDWKDLVQRVRGIGEGNAAKFSDQGLTVNGSAFKSVEKNK